MSNDIIRNQIIQVIKSDKEKKIPAGIIVRKITNQFSSISKHAIFKTIDVMLENGELRKLFNDKLVLGYINAPIDKSQTFIGTISINSHLDGFINVYDDNKNLVNEFYVNKINVNQALHGDKVKFALLQKEVEANNLKEAAVLEVLERNKNSFVAEVIFDNNSYQIIPDDKKLYLDIQVDNLDHVQNHDKVLIQIIKIENKTIFGRVIKIIGSKTDIGVDIESIVFENNAPFQFSNEVLNVSSQLQFKITNEDLLVRKDIRNRKIITIDPATSKDLDDSIYLEKLSNGHYFLSVSIADVSHYVQPDSILDHEAIQRCTSIYLVDRVIPMLPANISDNLCSLNPHEDKMTLTCDMEIDLSGNVVNYQVYPSIMNNHHRFSYDEVNHIFSNKIFESSDIDPDILQQLWWGQELHHILRRKKHEQGYIEFETKEPYIKLDQNGVPIEIICKTTGMAQKMIEDFMVACNETVTLFANDHDLPFIYRNHDKPELKRIDTFLVECKKNNFYTNVDYTNLKSKDFLWMIEKNKTHEHYRLFDKLLRKVMPKAKYAITNIGHFGLATTHYTHFTSPIRRYTDLIIHRIFWMFVFTPNKYTELQKQNIKAELSNIAEQCNMCEIRQVETERAVNSMKFAEYMSYRIGMIYEGTISTVVSYGFFVELDDIMVEGLVSVKNIGDDFYDFNQETFTFIGRRNNKVYSIGQRVKIQVLSASKQERKIDFKIIR